MKAIIRAQAAPWRQSVELFIADSDMKCRVKELIMEEMKDNCFAEAPSLHLSNTAAQTLMDDLWNAGLRPTEGTGSAGSLRATEKHLEDMRTLVFHTTGIKSI